MNQIFKNQIFIFTVMIQKPMEKYYWLFVEGKRVMLTSELDYKITSSLQHSIAYIENSWP